MPRPEFERNLAQGSLRVEVPTSPTAFLEERMSLLQQTLDETDALARCDQLPDVELSSAGLKISPIEKSVPREADALKEALYGMLPHVKITDLLMEVDRWTCFTRHFVHLKTLEPAMHSMLLLTTILADAINLGLAKWPNRAPAPATRSSRGCRPGISAMRPMPKLWPNSSTTTTGCRSPIIGGKEPRRLPTASGSGPEARPSHRPHQSQIREPNRARPSIPTSPISTRLFIPRSSTSRYETPRMFSTACSTMSPTCGSRSTTPIRPASPITSSPYAPPWLPLRAAHPRSG